MKQLRAACEILTNKKMLVKNVTTSVQQKVFPFFTETQQLSTLTLPIVRRGLVKFQRQIYQLIPFY